MSTEYFIRTPVDFMSVPKYRREAMLIDLGEWMAMRDELAPLIDAGLVELPNEFHWCDDGMAGLSQVNITIKPELKEQEVE